MDKRGKRGKAMMQRRFRVAYLAAIATTCVIVGMTTRNDVERFKATVEQLAGENEEKTALVPMRATVSRDTVDHHFPQRVGSGEIVFASSEPLSRSVEYIKGFNAALQAIMLLDLELDLKGERKTWGEMADICRERFGVPQSESKERP